MINSNKPGLPNYTGPNEGWALWVHHEEMLEYCTDFQGRIAYILKEKHPHQHATRLAALTYLTPDEIPPALATARTALDTARTALATAWTARDTARTALDTARTALDTAWTARDTAWRALDTAIKDAIPLLLPLCEQHCAGLYQDGSLLFPMEEPS